LVESIRPCQNAYVGLSIGVSLYPCDGNKAEEILKRADAAMYQAKNDGKNTFKYFSKAIEEQVKRKSRIGQNLQQALINNEFNIVYQPILECQESKITGGEALLRWNSPELGIIPPDEFIPIAEDIGMINAIDDWVLLNACKQNKKWQDEGFDPIVVSVNLSASHFNSNRIVSSVTRALSLSQLSAAFIELEVTETAMMKDAKTAIECLEQLKSVGVSLALDDFGTGYSSIGYLRRFKLDRIKIDQTFLQNIPSSEEDTLTTNTIIALASNLNLKVTAEGVEALEQLSFIQNTVCDSVQGYYFSKPVAAKAFKKLLQCSLTEVKES
jgi:EAL domain-containing protein (putative c-di-GMP-specific phosphodiesterase class I)